MQDNKDALARPFVAGQSPFKISKNLWGLGVSSTLAINNYVRTHQGMVNFGLGESPFGPPSVVSESLKKYVKNASYLPSEGIRPLREQISKFYSHYFDINTNPDSIVVGPGSKELLFLTITALDTNWLFPTPSWVSYEAQARISNKSVFRTNGSSDKNFRITKNQLQKSLPSGPTSLLINYPNNPTGMSLKKSEVKRIANFARNNEVVIISDEIYANTLRSSFGEKHHSFVKEYPEGTIITGGVSKDRSMGGWRLGVAIYPEEGIKNTVRSIASETYSSVSSPIQYACIDAYKPQLVDDHIKTSTRIHDIVGEYVYKNLKDMGFIVSRPEGAFYLMPSLNHMREKLHEKGIETSTDLVKALLSYGVAVVSGKAFGMSEQDLSFRLAYIGYDGVSAMKSFKEDNFGSDEFIRKNMPSVVEGMVRLKSFMDSLL